MRRVGARDARANGAAPDVPDAPIDADHPLEDILHRAVAQAQADGKLEVRELLGLFGTRSLGPLLIIFGLIAAVPPIGAIPLIPTSMGVLTFLLSIQFVLGRRRIWIPEIIGQRSISARRMAAAERRGAKVLSWVDRLLKPRLRALTRPVLNRVVAVVACLVAFLMPPLEIVPFGVVIPGVALVCLGLGLVARDGLFTLFGLIVAAGAALVVLFVVPRMAQEAAEATEEVRAEVGEAVEEAAGEAARATEAAVEEAAQQMEAVTKEVTEAIEAVTEEEAADEGSEGEPGPGPDPAPEPEAAPE